MFQDGDMDPDDWREQRDELTDERDAADAQVERLRSRDDELSSESTDTIDATTAEQLTAIRRTIVDHVRGAGDVRGVRAALLTMFELFTLRGGEIDLTPRAEAIAGWTLDPALADDDLWRRELIATPKGGRSRPCTRSTTTWT